MTGEVINIRPQPDRVLVEVADYARNYRCTRSEAIDTARYDLLDALGCGVLALRYP
jgi:2-methylcitrate dehydratase